MKNVKKLILIAMLVLAALQKRQNSTSPTPFQRPTTKIAFVEKLSTNGLPRNLRNEKADLEISQSSAKDINVAELTSESSSSAAIGVDAETSEVAVADTTVAENIELSSKVASPAATETNAPTNSQTDETPVPTVLPEKINPQTSESLSSTAKMSVTSSSSTALNSPTTSSSQPSTSTTGQPSSTQTSQSASTSTVAVTTTTTSAATTTASTTTTAIRMTTPTTATTQKANVSPTCPSSTCVKEKSFFKSDGSLADPSIHGFWKTACGKLYMFGKVPVNWEQNVAACCKLGMTPITLESSTHSTCFDKFVDGYNWLYNSRYWTSGLRTSDTTFTWCSTGNYVNVSTLWGYKEPNNENGTENCAQLVISKENSTAKLQDRECGVVSALACQGPTTPPPPCVSPVCPSIYCSKNRSLFNYLPDGQTDHLIDPPSLGTWVFVNDRSYIFSYPNDTRSYADATRACCNFGAKLVSLHQEFKFKALSGALKTGKVTPALFWTSGTDLGCEDSFGYCTTNRLVRYEAKWASGQPDNKNGNENCLAVGVNETSALLSDMYCYSKYRYICEGRARTGAEVVEAECSQAFNLTKDQVNKLLVQMPSNLQEKCFLKCFGEGTDMFVDGKLVEEKVIAQFASLSAGDVNELMNMYNTLDFCSNMTRGMDECDKASKLLECGKENSPQAIAGLMSNIENSLASPPLVLPPKTAVCPMDYKCAVDDTLRTLVDTAANFTLFQKVPENAFTAQMTHGCGKKFVFVDNISYKLTFKDTLQFCCKFGMRMVSVETEAKYKCMLGLGVTKLLDDGTTYAVAANRMGFVLKPIWCFSNNIVNWTIGAVDYYSSNTSDVANTIHLSFTHGDPNQRWFLNGNAIRHFGCETF